MNSNNKIIIVQTTGDLFKSEMAEMDKCIRTKANELKYKILFDFRLSKSRISIADAYFWFTDFYKDDERILISIPTAHLSSVEDEDFFRFFETTTNNSGIPIKMFMENKQAFEWLKQF